MNISILIPDFETEKKKAILKIINFFKKCILKKKMKNEKNSILIEENTESEDTNKNLAKTGEDTIINEENYSIMSKNLLDLPKFRNSNGTKVLFYFYNYL